MDLPVPIIPLELPAYSRKENWGASRNLLQASCARCSAARCRASPRSRVRAGNARPDARRAVNLLGALLARLPVPGRRRRGDGVCSNRRRVSRSGSSRPSTPHPQDLAALPEADANVCLYPEVAHTACKWLERTFGQPTIKTVPIGVGATLDFLRELGRGGSTSMSIFGARRVDTLAAALVLAQRRFHLSHRQAGVHLRRCDARRCGRAGRQGGDGLRGGGSRHLQPRVRRARSAQPGGRVRRSRR
jgi:hypothetical protein